MKVADEKAREQERPAKKAKKAKAQKIPALTQAFTHNKILDAEERLLKGLRKREERAKARVKQLGSLKKKSKPAGAGGS